MEETPTSLRVRIRDILNEGSLSGLRGLLADTDPSRIANELYGFAIAHQGKLIRMMDIKDAAKLFGHLDSPLRMSLIDELGLNFVSGMIGFMEPDKATDLVGLLEHSEGAALLNMLPQENREQISFLLTYDEDTAGGLMDPDVVVTRADRTVGAAIEDIRRYVDRVRLDHFFTIFVVGDDQRLLGAVPNWKMLLAGREEKIADIMNGEVLSVGADMDQEEVSNLVREQDLVVVPVVDPQGRLIGRITVDDIVDVIEEEHREDLGRMTGTGREEIKELSIVQTIRLRAPFLLVALVGEFILARIMQTRQDFLGSLPALALFIPLIMAMGGNTGVQSASLVIQGLASGELRLSHFRRRLMREMGVALGLGSLFALILIGGGAGLTGNLKLGGVVGLTTLCMILLATTMGTMIPMLLKRLQFDPALATGPFITTMNDVLGILVYLSLAFLMLT